MAPFKSLTSSVPNNLQSAIWIGVLAGSGSKVRADISVLQKTSIALPYIQVSDETNVGKAFTHIVEQRFFPVVENLSEAKVENNIEGLP